MVRIKVTDEEAKIEEKAVSERPETGVKQSIPQGSAPQDQAGKVVPEELDREKLLERNREIQETADKNFDLYLRAQAEMENMRKRYQREKGEWAKFANESIIRDLLPVMDNLGKATAHASNEISLEDLKEGVELTLKGLKEVLSRAGLEEVKALGEKFDPNFHEAISLKEDDVAENGTVLIEVQKGYTLNGRLVRPAMVVVSKKK